MDRAAKRHQDLHQSVMRLCEGDPLQYDKVVKSAVSLYAAKLQNFADVYKVQKKEAKKNEVKNNQNKLKRK